jgi:hypothetical protein
VRAALTISRPLARKASIVHSRRGSSTVVVARGTARLKRARRRVLVVRFTTPARRGLRGSRRVDAGLRLTASDGTGAAQLVKRRVRLRR